jgi:hypothetical protein
MRKVLLAAISLAMVASMAPAHAVTSTYIRTINAPTASGGTEGVVYAPDILVNPTNPNAWRKYTGSSLAARCGYVKQTEGVLPAGTAQDATSGKFGYVFALPGAFGAGDSFSLTADPSNAPFDFDVVFYSSIGKCVSDRQVGLPAGQGCLVVPLEGSRPLPDAREQQEAPNSGGGCPNAGGPKNSFTKIGNESATLTFDANFAVVTMPVGAQGIFKLVLTY